MKIFTITAMAILFIIFIGCSGGKTAGVRQTVEMGYSTEMVKEIMGSPNSIKKENFIYKWYYQTSQSIKILFFEEDKLTIVYYREF